MKKAGRALMGALLLSLPDVRGHEGRTNVLGLHLENSDVEEMIKANTSLEWLRECPTARFWGVFQYEGRLAVEFTSGCLAKFVPGDDKGRYTFEGVQKIRVPLRLGAYNFGTHTHYVAEPDLRSAYAPNLWTYTAPAKLEYSLCGRTLRAYDRLDAIRLDAEAASQTLTRSQVESAVRQETGPKKKKKKKVQWKKMHRSEGKKSRDKKAVKERERESSGSKPTPQLCIHAATEAENAWKLERVRQADLNRRNLWVKYWETYHTPGSGGDPLLICNREMSADVDRFQVARSIVRYLTTTNPIIHHFVRRCSRSLCTSTS